MSHCPQPQGRTCQAGRIHASHGRGTPSVLSSSNLRPATHPPAVPNISFRLTLSKLAPRNDQGYRSLPAQDSPQLLLGKAWHSFCQHDGGDTSGKDFWPLDPAAPLSLAHPPRTRWERAPLSLQLTAPRPHGLPCHRHDHQGQPCDPDAGKAAPDSL